MIDTVLWDLDGTVLDSKPGVFASIAFALRSLGLPFPELKALNAFLGPPIAEGFRHICAVPDDKVDDAIYFYRQYYNAGGKFEATIYDGVKETLQHFRDAGIRNYITTSKPRIFAEQILDHFGLSSLFDGIYGCELDGTRSEKSEVLEYCILKERLCKSSTVLVGDRCFDVNGAANVSIACIGVLYGYGDVNELSSSYSLVENTQQLESLILGM